MSDDDIFKKTIEQFDEERYIAQQRKKDKQSAKKKHVSKINKIIKHPIIRWGLMSLAILMSITALFLCFILFFSVFKEKISDKAVPWIYVFSYIVSTLIVGGIFLFLQRKLQFYKKM